MSSFPPFPENGDFESLSPEMNNFRNENHTICRVCLDKSPDNGTLVNLFPEDGSELEFLPFRIMACASVHIIRGDGLPCTICQKCLANLNVAWQFKVQCELSDATFRQFKQDPSFPPQLNGGDNFDLETDPGDKIFTEPKKKQHEIIESPLQKLTENTKITNPKTEKSSIRRKPVRRKKETPSLTSSSQNSGEPHKCETCGKSFYRKEYLIQHERIHTGEKPYCCHLCEKRFVNSGHLAAHMRTHTGERPHMCQMCPKSFATRQQLQKHTMVHNGLRPFVCTTCGKCFGSTSNLYSHRKHHTGEKNFTCEHCGKTFYSNQELKQHLRVHTGEKAYRCRICGKSFTQSSHLKRHAKTHDANE